MSVRTLFAKTPLIARIVALYIVAAAGGVGVALFVPEPIPAQASYADKNPASLEQQATDVAEEQTPIQGTPTRIQIDRINLDLAVKPGTYDPTTKEWTLTNTEAFFATVSNKPGTEPGTTFIYGHNRASAFGPLAGIESGDTVVLTLEDGTTLTYVYARDARVTPDSINVMYEKSDYPQLVLMTCEGLFSDVRRLMYFTLQEVS